MVALLSLAVAGCSTGELPEARGQSDGGLDQEPDVRVRNNKPNGETSDPDAGDTGGGEPDVSEGPAPTQAFTRCAAGGRSTNGQVTAIQCFGPAEVSSREVGDGDVRWRPGAFRVIVPNR